MAPHVPDLAKVSPYECGFTGKNEQTRNTFSVQFYNVALLFLLFDLEILLVFPSAVSLYETGLYTYIVLALFFLILTIGFLLEISSGIISLSSNANLDKNN